MRDRESELVRERKERTIADCGGGSSGDERRISTMELERVVTVLEERGRFKNILERRGTSLIR